MDFTLPYSDEQQRFRQEVRTWLDKNVPEEMKEPVDPRDYTKEQYLFWRQKHQELAKKGWLYPTFPKEYGGGGLSGEHETIIEEEFTRARVVRGPNGGIMLAALLVWGTEAQRQKFLTPMLKAEVTSWQKFTEPQSGADLANYQTRAVKDGDDWVITGQNVFVSGRPRPQWGFQGLHYLWGPALTDPDAPRHRNLGFFMIPYPSPGLTIQEQKLVNGWEQHFIFLDNVRVPGDHMIGGDHQGWQVANTALEQEHGGRGQAFPRDEMVDNMLSFVKEGKEDNAVQQQVAMGGYIDGQIYLLLQKRT